jgi:plasmid stability protein
MPTLYIENVPEDLYEALRLRAEANRTFIADEVLAVLSENLPTRDELARRRRFLVRARSAQAVQPLEQRSFPSTEEMQRAGRRR